MNWFYTISVFVILITGCYILISSEHRKNTEIFKTQSEQNILLLSEIIQNDLLNNNYTAVISAIEKWYLQHPSIYEIKLQSKNGFILSHLKTRKQTSKSISHKHNIQYGYRGNVSIEIANSLEYIVNNKNKDIYYLLLISIIITFASGEFLWLIEQKRYTNTLETLSYRDQLTEIFNRRYFDETLQQEWHRASRTEQTLSLIMIDIDYFKDYNDQFGHQAGDLCLTRIAGALHKTLKRPGEFVARYGGEEFAVVLPNIGHSHVKEIAEMLRQSVVNLSIPLSNENPEDDIVTISLGIATHDALHVKSPQQLILHADRALYQAKEAGRNCVKTS